MATMEISLLTGFATASISAVVTYVATRFKVLLDLTAEYDKELRRDRLDAYRKLWAKLKPIARYSLQEPITYQIIKKTADEMRDWYFDEGGIFLTAESRIPYFALKKEMQLILKDRDLQTIPDHPLPLDTTSLVVAAGSRLRTSLSNDIGSRQKPLLYKKMPDEQVLRDMHSPEDEEIKV